MQGLKGYVCKLTAIQIHKESEPESIMVRFTARRKEGRKRDVYF